jgi:hypothetical protein
LGFGFVNTSNAWWCSVATVALNGAKMPILAAQIIGSHDQCFRQNHFYKEGLKQAVDKAASELKK